MAAQSKNWRLPSLLVAVGLVIFFITFKQNTPSHKIVLQEVFAQKPFAAPTIPSGESPTIRKDPVPSPAIVASPGQGRQAGFAVQVYSFQNQKKADVALVNLKNSGYTNAYMIVSDLGEKGVWYRVRIGGLQSEDEAQVLLETIRKNYNSGFIIKPQKQ